MTELVRKQRAFHRTGKTRDLAFREGQLDKLREGLRKHEANVIAALKSDLGKAPSESFLAELMLVYDELHVARRQLRSWAKPRRVPSPWLQAIASSRIYWDPLGVSLIVGPWNYPFQLALAPLVGAIAAGNCAVIKPSELSPATSKAIAALVADVFDPEYVAVVEGGVDVSTRLLAERWDHIFFTGGIGVGKIVMTAAAKHLTPVTLELGGKSPCILDASADLDVSAKRIAWGKYFNAGQTCVAPDYLLVQRSVKDALLERVRAAVGGFFGADAKASPDYGRIINDRHFSRLASLVDNGKLYFGGDSVPDERYLAPTVLTDVSPDAKVMQEEIFGPILPVIEYDTLDEAIHFINDRPKPLALYFFSKDRERQERVMAETSFGGGCVNDTLVHLSNPCLPFGGVGESGLGAYHGKFSFETFSHRKGVMKRSFVIDPSVRYPPYKDRLSLLRKFFG